MIEIDPVKVLMGSFTVKLTQLVSFLVILLRI